MLWAYAHDMSYRQLASTVFFIRNKKRLVLKIPFLVFRILWNKTLQQWCGLEET